MRHLRRLFLAPASVLQLALYFCPLLIIVVYSVLTNGVYGGAERPFTAENYQRLLDPIYLRVLLHSFGVAAIATGICLAAGFPMALFIARSGKRRNLYLSLVILPFWTSFLVRTYAWMFLLRDTGLINTLLISLGVIRQPLPLLYNYGAVILGLVYAYLPFMVLPLYATLERMDPDLLDAAADLGARPWQTLVGVIIPYSRPGIVAGGTLVFIPCLGAYLTPALLGGGRTILAGTLIQNQFTTARDWPFGAACSLVLMAIVMLVLMGVLRRQEEYLP